MNHTGTLVVLAWPDTKVVCVGKWYDNPMRWIGAIKDGKFSAGHAAFLLINNTSGDTQYFDFGRYHTPIKYGRVRSKLTDPDIEMIHKAIIKDGTITNFDQILVERYNNKACHGDGRLTAAIVKNIDYAKAYNKVMKMQEQEAINYGPFALGGTTCSRLVAQTVLISTSNWLTKLMVIFPYTVSSTPRSNNKVLNDCCHYYEVDNDEITMKKSKFFWFKRVFQAQREEGVRISVKSLPIDSI